MAQNDDDHRRPALPIPHMATEQGGSPTNQKAICTSTPNRRNAYTDASVRLLTVGGQVSYSVDWFIPIGTEPLKKQGERASEGQSLPVSSETLALRQAVATEIQLLNSSLKIHSSVRGSDEGCWIGSDDPECLVPYVEIGNGTAMVQGGLGFDNDFNDLLLRVYEILLKNGFVGYDPHVGKIFRGVEEAVKLQTGR